MLVTSGVRIAGVTAMLVGSFWLAAWLSGFAAQWSAVQDQIIMKTNMSLGQILAGGALLLLGAPTLGRSGRMVGTVAALIVLSLGALTLSQHLFHYDLGIDQLLASEAPGARGTASPNRMGYLGSLSLTLLGTGLLALASKWRPVAPYLGLAVCIVNLLPAVGFLYGIDLFYSRTLTGIAWPTVLALSMLGIGLMLAHRDGDPMILLLRDDLGGVLFRRILPAALTVPLVLGYFRVQGERMGLYDTATGTGGAMIIMILLLSMLAFRAARALSYADATRLKAEMQLRNQGELMDHAREPLIVRTLGGSVLSWNRGAETLYVWPAADALGRNIYYILQTEGTSLDDMNAQLERTGHWEGELIRTARDGRRVIVESRQTATHSTEGDTLILESDRDITMRRRKEAEIQQILDELEKQISAADHAEAANRAKSVFLANISHELRTPLNVILGFSRLLANDPQATAEQVQKSKLIVGSGEKLLHLIDNVLDLAKIEADRVEIEQAQFDLHQLLHETHLSMQVRAVEKGLSFAIALSSDLPRHVTADSGKLHQVLVNLIGNAIKFTRSGSVILRAKVDNWESPQRALVSFEIEDTGPGIRETDLQRIFSRFVQLPDHPPAEAGTGLGLVISEQYVELMGGRVAVTSEIGKGSIFRFDIPVTVNPNPFDIGISYSQRMRITGLAEEQQHYRLLIAEDHPGNRLLLRSILEPLGFEIREAENGQEAVAQYETWHPHLIWMDIRMPILNGLDATRRIREIDPGGETKIVAVTAHALEHERNEILAAGCDDFIRKPYAETAIFDALAKHLGVRFKFAEEHSPVAAGELSELGLAQLEKLPPGVLLELRDAAVLLDEPRCLELARSIGAIDSELGASLRHMFDNLRYQELLVVLDMAIGVGSS